MNWFILIRVNWTLSSLSFSVDLWTALLAGGTSRRNASVNIQQVSCCRCKPRGSKTFLVYAPGEQLLLDWTGADLCIQYPVCNTSPARCRGASSREPVWRIFFPLFSTKIDWLLTDISKLYQQHYTFQYLSNTSQLWKKLFLVRYELKAFWNSMK